MFLRLSIPPQTGEQRAELNSGRASVIAEPTYGTQLQELGIQGHLGEGRMIVIYEEVPVELSGGEVVKLRYFVGMTLPESAEALGISPRTADRLWAYARSWLRQEIES